MRVAICQLVSIRNATIGISYPHSMKILNTLVLYLDFTISNVPKAFVDENCTEAGLGCCGVGMDVVGLEINSYLLFCVELDNPREVQ
jgi:hypothetical protein